MRPALNLGLLALALSVGPAHGEDVKPAIDFGGMKVEVTWVGSNADRLHPLRIVLV